LSPIDYSSGVGPKIRKQLDEDMVVWMTTTSADGTPQPNPVWFIVDGDDIIVYSHKTASRNKNVVRNPRVSLNFNSDHLADSMSVITGTAVIDEAFPKADQNSAFLEKYGEQIPAIGMTPDSYTQTYSVTIRITPTKIRGW
jgi:PPOX class probable F420-dependent enzyme